MRKKRVMKEFIILTAAVFAIAVAVYFFMMPANLVMGSMSGLALVLVHVIPMPISLMTFLLGAGILILGTVLIGKEFGIKTVYTSLLLPVFLRVFEMLFPENASLTDEVLLDALCCILLVSMGQALLFQVNASSGGTDIIAKILNKYLHLELGTGVALTGGIIVLSSAFVYNTKILVIGIVSTYFNGVLLEEFIGGLTRKKRISILSEKHEELQQYILHDLNRGVTLYSAQGGYDNRMRKELITVLTREEYALLLNKIREVDEKAFVTVSTVSEVIGSWRAGRRTSRF